MRLVAFEEAGKDRLGLVVGDTVVDLPADLPQDLKTLLEAGPSALASAAKASGASRPLQGLRYRVPITRSNKILCFGLNYVDHAAEGGSQVPEYPAVFVRVDTSLVPHDQPILRPKVSTMLDYESELVAIIGKGGKDISRDNALDHVAGYSVFNDGSIRDFQRKAGGQWCVGKNFDGTGGFGPFFVSADEVPPGAAGLKIEGRLNGQVMQSANTSQMVFDVVEAVHLMSQVFTLEPGDVLVMGTPAGVGAARKPPVFMKAGDVFEVEIEKVGLLRNPIADA